MSEFRFESAERSLEFVTLLKVVAAISENIELPAHFDDRANFQNEEFKTAAQAFYKEANPKIERLRRVSIAALRLNYVLHSDAASRLVWLKFDTRKRFEVKTQEAKEQGIDLLTKLTSRGNDVQTLCANHIREACVGYRWQSIDKNLISQVNYFDNSRDSLDAARIGFRLGEIIELLLTESISFSSEHLADCLGLSDIPSEQTESRVKSPDYSMLATRDALIRAFGTFTEMEKSWFDNLSDKPRLRAARKVRGQGGRSRTIDPLFCPYEVMKWLIDPDRRVGREMRSETGWRLLRAHFNKVYITHELEAPEVD